MVSEHVQIHRKTKIHRVCIIIRKCLVWIHGKGSPLWILLLRRGHQFASSSSSSSMKSTCNFHITAVVKSIGLSEKEEGDKDFSWSSLTAYFESCFSAIAVMMASTKSFTSWSFSGVNLSRLYIDPVLLHEIQHEMYHEHPDPLDVFDTQTNSSGSGCSWYTPIKLIQDAYCVQLWIESSLRVANTARTDLNNFSS